MTKIKKSDPNQLVTRAILKKELKKEFLKFGESIAVTFQDFRAEMDSMKIDIFEMRGDIAGLKQDMTDVKREIIEIKDNMVTKTEWLEGMAMIMNQLKLLRKRFSFA